MLDLSLSLSLYIYDSVPFIPYQANMYKRSSSALSATPFLFVRGICVKRFGIVLGPSQTIMDGFWTKTLKSEATIQIDR